MGAMGGAGRISSLDALHMVQEMGGTEQDFEKVLLIERLMYPALVEFWEAEREKRKAKGGAGKTPRAHAPRRRR